MLEALHPGRIDLGLGRAPGSDQLTAMALRRNTQPETVHDFPRQLVELLGYFDGTAIEGDRFARIRATPGEGYRPAIWLLGSSDFSAHLAGQLGLPFSFAHHFSGQNTDAAVAAYRANFRPSAVLEQPYVMLGVNVLCAPTTEEAQYLTGPSALAMVRLRLGRPDVYPTPEEAAAHEFTPMEREIASGWGANHVLGDPATVRAGLEDLVARTRADELMITTVAHDPEHRLRSYRLVADAVDPNWMSDRHDFPRI
jgi:luciferase family oxidoreductase group 1